MNRYRWSSLFPLERNFLPQLLQHCLHLSMLVDVPRAAIETRNEVGLWCENNAMRCSDDWYN